MNADDIKTYQCRVCKHESEQDTNHFGGIIEFCKVCKEFTYHDYTGEVPKDGWIPAPFPEDHVKMLNHKYPNGIIE